MPEYICLSCQHPEYIFVFGSNLAGRYNSGAALHALKYHGASRQIVLGMSGNSFAIPVQNEWNQTFPLDIIRNYILNFIEYAKANQDKTFFVTKIGTGLIGYSNIQIAPFFATVPFNCILPDEWQIK